MQELLKILVQMNDVDGIYWEDEINYTGMVEIHTSIYEGVSDMIGNEAYLDETKKLEDLSSLLKRKNEEGVKTVFFEKEGDKEVFYEKRYIIQ